MAATVLWSRQTGTTDGHEIEGLGVDAAGNTGAAGVLYGNEHPYGMTSVGGDDVWIASHAPSGAVRWTRQLGAPGDQNAYDVQCDDAGNIYIAGKFANTVDFGGVSLTSAGGFDMFMAKWAPDGDLVWAKRFGGSADQGGNELAVQPDGSITVAGMSGGSFEGNAWVGPGADGYVMRLTPAGALVRVTRFNGLGAGWIRGIGVNDAGEVAVGILFTKKMTWNGGSAIPAGFGGDGAVAKLNADGSIAWVKIETGSGKDFVNGTAIAQDGTVYAGGKRNGDDFLSRRNSATGAEAWRINIDTGLKGLEVRLHDGGVLVSGGIGPGLTTIKRGTTTLTTFSRPRQTPILASFSTAGELRWFYTPTVTAAGSGGYGAMMGVNGSACAWAIRFAGTVVVDGQSMTALAAEDGALIRLTLE